MCGREDGDEALIGWSIVHHVFGNEIMTRGHSLIVELVMEFGL
jgi:hypothetical protein